MPAIARRPITDHLVSKSCINCLHGGQHHWNEEPCRLCRGIDTAHSGWAPRPADDGAQPADGQPAAA